MNLRLFVGITAPEEWKTAITQWRRKVERQFGNSFGRWTAPANLHLTLRFFGSVEESQVADINNRLQDAASSSTAHSVSPGPLGCFPNPSRPRIFWLGLKGADLLIDLESRLRAATAAFGQPPDNRPFHPHLTLARLKAPTRRDRDALAELIQNGPSLAAPDWQIHELELVRSEPTSDGSVYTKLAGFKLGNTLLT